MSAHQLTLQNVIPSTPSTTRAIPTRLSTYQNNNNNNIIDIIAYPTGNNIVVGEFNENLTNIFFCGVHAVPVTAVRISPTGKLIASGDINGNINIWLRQADTRVILQTKQLQGPVRDIAWTGDEERLVIVGEGKNIFAIPITITANTIGVINGHSQNIFSCDMRLERPYRIVTGSADSLVGFYEGVPFKFKCNIKGHTEKVTCVRYSPDMETIATVSRSSEIIFLDGKTGEIKKSIATTHNGTIYAIAWSLDGNYITTASADKNVKIYEFLTGKEICSCCLGNNVNDMQQGVVYTSQGVLSVSLGGKLTLIDKQGKIKKVITGHQGRIILLQQNSDGTLISVGVERVLISKGCTTENIRELPITSNIITAATIFESNLYLISDGNLLYCNLSDTNPTILLKDVGNITALSVILGEYIILLSKNGFIVINASGNKVTEEKLNNFDGTSTSAHGNTFMLGGDKLVKSYQLNINSFNPICKSCVDFTGHHTGIVACMTFSADGSRVASGDANRNIFVWSPSDGSILYKDLIFHTLRVTSLAFDPNDNSKLISGGMDATLIVWDLKTNKRKTEDAAHRGGVSAVAWTRDGKLISGGADFCIREWSIA